MSCHKYTNTQTARIMRPILNLSFIFESVISEPTDLSGTVISVEEMWKRVDLYEISVNDNPPLIPEYNNRKKNRKQEVISSSRSFKSVHSRVMHDGEKKNSP